MFLNPLLLIGLSAAVLPVVLHLLSRARYRSVDWGAMMFLEGTDPRQQQSSRMHQWVLLLVRCGMIALLAVALARPVLRGKFAAPGQGQKLTAVILLDCSGSMGFDENGTQRMVLARGAAKQVLALHKGDRVSLVLMGQDQPADERRPTTDLWDVGRRIDEADPGPGKADVAAALMDAVALLGENPRGAAGGAPSAPGEGEFVSFYVVTDRQDLNWRDVDPAFAVRFRDALARAGADKAARLFVIPVGGNDADNVAVESVTLLNGPAVVGQPAEIEVKVRNHGPVQWASLPLLVTTSGADRTKVLDTKLNLLPGTSVTLRERVRYREPGTHVVRAELNRPASGAASGPPLSPQGSAGPPRPTGFTADDTLETVVPVIEPIKVLVISGDEPGSAAAPWGESEYLRFALAPFKAARREGTDLCAVDVVTPEAWAGATASVATGKRAGDAAAREVALGDYQVVVLANVERLRPQQVLAVEQFVYDGGGLLIAPGNLSRPEHYNEVLHKQGSGIMPAALGEPTDVDGEGETSLSGFEPNHPVFRFLGGRPDAFLSAVVGRYFRVEGGATPGGRVLARYVTGDPFLIEPASGEIGRGGRVLLATTALDADWSTLPATSFYLPFVQSMVRYLADTSLRRTVLNAGEAIEVPLDPSAPSRRVRISTPDGQERQVETLRRGPLAYARFTDTQQPGLYEVHVGPSARPLHFVVRGAGDESDLTVLTPEKWEWLRASLGAETVDTASRSISASTIGSTGSRELWAWVLGGALLLAVVEMALARLWGRTEVADADGAFEPIAPAG